MEGTAMTKLHFCKHSHSTGKLHTTRQMLNSPKSVNIQTSSNSNSNFLTSLKESNRSFQKESAWISEICGLWEQSYRSEDTAKPTCSGVCSASVIFLSLSCWNWYAAVFTNVM